MSGAGRVVVGLALLLAAGGCVRSTPPVRLAQTTKVAVAYVQDPESGGESLDVPDALRAEVDRALAERNLEVEEVPFEQVANAFSRVRASERRFELLRQYTHAPLLLLVETKPTFFSQIAGRYRWTVTSRLTAEVRDAKAPPSTRSLEESVTLLYDHERGPQAIASGAPGIAESAGKLFDDLLATPPSGPNPTSTPGSDPQGPRAPKEPRSSVLPQPGAIYYVMVDRFANGDPSNDGQVDPKDPAAFHGGDLQGVIAHLDELKALGVETVWLSPIFRMRTEKFFGYGAFHGYWVYDLTRVEPRFGDRRSLRRLSDELHARGMKLLLDVVLNHVGPEAPLEKEKPGWFHHAGPLTDWKDPEQLVTHDVDGLPDLAQEKPEVYRYLLDASLQWIREVRPDGFRLDAVKHMPLEFWSRYTRDVRAAAGPQFLLLGEMLDGDPKVLARTGREGGFGALFDFPLHFATVDVFCKDQPATKLGAVLSSDRLYEDASTLVTLADNHDLPRVMTACGGELERVKQALLFTLTARGTPSLTWGTEAGLEGAKEPENRGDMRFGSGSPLGPFITRVLEVRRRHPSLVEGIPWTLDAGPDRLVEARLTDGEAAIVAVNRGSAPLALTLPEELAHGDWHEALTQAAVRSTFTVPARSVALFVGRGKSLTQYRPLRERAWAIWKGRAGTREVDFEVRAPKRQKGEVLRVIGSAPELGAWDVTRAPVVPEDGRVRTALPVGTVAELKLVLQQADGQLRWEEGDNQALFVRSGAGALEVPVRWSTTP